MSKIIDLTGKKFGEWVVINKDNSENVKHGVHWICKCNCGAIKSVHSQTLRNGASTSCGCKTKELISKANRVHGLKTHKLFGVHNTMKQRCANPNSQKYKLYGGRGITVCEEWKKFINFYNWAISNGYKEGLSIDRIDNDGDYEPSNCKWETTKVQANNTRRNRKLEYKGEVKTLSEWSNILKLDYMKLKFKVKGKTDLNEVMEDENFINRARYFE